MNSALNKLYVELKIEADLAAGGVVVVEMTAAEKARQYVEDKRKAIERLNEISEKRAAEEAALKKQKQLAELEKRREWKRLEKERKALKEKAMLLEMQRKTKKFVLRDSEGRPYDTGVEYFGDFKQVGGAWVPHGQHGEYKVKGEVIYEGAFADGLMHGKGTLLLPNTKATWEGNMWRDTMDGYGILVTENDDQVTQRTPIIYYRGKLICHLSDLHDGARIKLLSSDHAPQGRSACILKPAATARKPARFYIKFDDGAVKLLDLSWEPFQLLHRTLPTAVLLDNILAQPPYNTPFRNPTGYPIYKTGNRYGYPGSTYDEDVARGGGGEVMKLMIKGAGDNRSHGAQNDETGNVDGVAWNGKSVKTDDRYDEGNRGDGMNSLNRWSQGNYSESGSSNRRHDSEKKMKSDDVSNYRENWFTPAEYIRSVELRHQAEEVELEIRKAKMKLTQRRAKEDARTQEQKNDASLAAATEKQEKERLQKEDEQKQFEEQLGQARLEAGSRNAERKKLVQAQRLVSNG